MPRPHRASSCLLLAVLVSTSSWLVIGSAWLLNHGWWSFLQGAFSDLGSSHACCPWVFNYGLILVSLLLFAYSICLWRAAASRIQAAGAAYLALSALFLAQVGLFPEGTEPHYCVSLWFFLLADAGLTLYTLPSRRGPAPCRLAFASAAAMLPLGLLVAATVGWPSTAALEAYAILLLEASMLGLAACMGKLR